MIRSFFVFSLFITLLSCSSSNTPVKVLPNITNSSGEPAAIDTNKILALEGARFKNHNFTVLYGHMTGSRRQVVRLSRNDQVESTLLFPVADEEVRNFGIHNISETPEGFKIQCSWGGGNYFYGRQFLFKYIKDSFFAYKIVLEAYQHGMDKKAERDSVLPRLVNIRDFDPLPYITNN